MECFAYGKQYSSISVTIHKRPRKRSARSVKLADVKFKEYEHKESAHEFSALHLNKLFCFFVHFEVIFWIV